MEHLKHESEPYGGLAALDVPEEANADAGESGGPFLVEAFRSSRSTHEVAELAGRADRGGAGDRSSFAHRSGRYHGSAKICTIGKIGWTRRYRRDREAWGDG
jgi:hypothetical protein